MLIRYLTFFLLVFTTITYGQYKNTDSLKIVLAKSKGQLKADVLSHLATSYIKSKPEESENYLKELINISNELNYAKGIINYKIIEGRLFYYKKKYPEAITKFKEAKEKAISAKNTKLVLESFTWLGNSYSATSACNEFDPLLQSVLEYESSNDGLKTKAALLSEKAKCFYFKGNIDVAMIEFKNSLNYYIKINDLKNIAGMGMNYGIMQYRNGAIKESLQTYQTSLESAKKLHDTLLIADCITNISMSEYELGNTKKSNDLMNEALKFYSVVKNEEKYATSLINYASRLFDAGKTTEALNCYITGLKTAEKIDAKDLISKFNLNIGEIYLRTFDTTMAMSYIEKGFEYASKNNLNLQKARALKTIGQIKFLKGKQDEALKCFKDAEDIFKSNNSTSELTALLNTLGNFYLRKKELDKAEEYYTQCLQLIEKTGRKGFIAGLNSNIGVVNYDRGNYDKSIEYYYKALALQLEVNLPQGISDSYLCLSNSYYKKGDFKLSYDFYRKYHLFLDSISKNESKKEMAEMKVKFETDKKEQEISMLSKDQALKTLLLDQNKKELLNQTLKNKGKEQEIELLNKDKLINDAKLKEAEYSELQKEIQLEAANKENKYNEQEAVRQRQIRNIILSALALALILSLFILRGYFQKRKSNKLISEQKRAVEEQNELIHHQKKEITDSINYAKRIQSAILPNRKEIDIEDFFIFYEPKDIVSGDFYFYRKLFHSYLIAVADCTGHGVPGAFMSLIGSKELNSITDNFTEPGEILEMLNRSIKLTLKQHQEGATRDGMDIAILQVSGNKVKYAGANRPLWYIKKNGQELIEIKATKHAIGGLTEDSEAFIQHELEFEKGDTLYLCSDGFADQFGGTKGKKFTTKKFKDILLSINNKSMLEQEEVLNELMKTWRGKIDQIDDILVTGIRI